MITIKLTEAELSYAILGLIVSLDLGQKNHKLARAKGITTAKADPTIKAMIRDHEVLIERLRRALDDAREEVANASK